MERMVSWFRSSVLILSGMSVLHCCCCGCDQLTYIWKRSQSSIQSKWENILRLPISTRPSHPFLKTHILFENSLKVCEIALCKKKQQQQLKEPYIIYIYHHCVHIGLTQNDVVTLNPTTNCIKMWSFFSRDSAKDFPYEIGEVLPGGLEQRSIWSLHRARRKTPNPTSGDDVSVFVYDIKSGSDTKLEIARSAVKKLKTMRHPSILQYLDSVETDKVLYVATECVEPFGAYVEKMDMEAAQKALYLAWGIFQITVCELYKHILCFIFHIGTCIFMVLFVNPLASPFVS